MHRPQCLAVAILHGDHQSPDNLLNQLGLLSTGKNHFDHPSRYLLEALEGISAQRLLLSIFLRSRIASLQQKTVAGFDTPKLCQSSNTPSKRVFYASLFGGSGRARNGGRSLT